MVLATELGAPRMRRAPPAPIPADREFGQIELLWRLRRNPLTIWRRQHFEDSIVAGKSVLGYGVVISDPAAIRHVLVDNVANYQKDALQRAILSPGLGEGLLTAEGDAWKRARRTLAPLFTPRRVEALAARMLSPIAMQVGRMAKRRPGRVFDITEDMTRLTYDVLAETLFSNSIAGGASAFGQALTRYFATQGRIDPLDVLGAPAWLPRIGRIRAKPAIEFFEQQIKTIVSDRHALRAGNGRPGDANSRDLLDALLDACDPQTGFGLSDEEVGANIVTFIGAGHETTANALTWALYLIATHADIMEQVEAEADTAADDPVGAALGEQLPMTRAVIEEAMRLYPPVPSLSRVALAEDVAGSVTIPKGAVVIVAPYVLHRHKTLWSDPDQFKPARFLPGQREKIERYAYLPFGAGPRICIGQQFAMVEAVLALTKLIGAFRFEYAGDAPPMPMHQITLRPQHGMPMKIRPRGAG